MNVLIALDNFDHGTGGAEACVRSLARKLHEAGNAVTVMQAGKEAGSHDWNGVAVHTREIPRPLLFSDRDRDTIRENRVWERHVAEQLEREPADLIVTQHRLSYGTVAAAKLRGIPVANFIHAYGVFCPTQFVDTDALAERKDGLFRRLPLLGKLKYPLVKANMARYERGLRDSSLIVVNSRYVGRVLANFYGLKSQLLYPLTDLDEYRADGRDGEMILFVKPQRVKGLPTFLDIARRMPDKRFLVVGKARSHVRRQFAQLPNVTHEGWTSDMKSVYRRTRLLLGPSIWPEPFGRIFIEAGVNGIPSVASRVGGIPESAGPGAILIDDILDADRWVEAIRSLDDPATYDELSAAARRHAESFNLDAGFETLRTIVREELDLEI